MESIKYKNKEIENFLESEYINIRDSESRTLEFLKNREQIVEKPDLNGNIVKKVQFIVVDPEDPQRRERKFELSRKHVPKIYSELKKGFSVLEIFRTGLGKQTEYHPKSIR